MHEYTVHHGKVNKCGLEKKTKWKNAEEAKRGRNKLDPNWHLVSIGLCQKYYNKKGLRNWLLWSCPIIQVLVQCACCMLRTFSNGTKHYILEHLATGLQMQMTTINSCFCSRSKNYNNSCFCCSLFRINLLYHIYWQQKKLDILAKKKFYIIFFFTSQIITCGTC